jgi:hypothetical protein
MDNIAVVGHGAAISGLARRTRPSRKIRKSSPREVLSEREHVILGPCYGKERVWDGGRARDELLIFSTPEVSREPSASSGTASAVLIFLVEGGSDILEQWEAWSCCVSAGVATGE